MFSQKATTLLKVSILIYLICILIEVWIFGRYMWDPNGLVFAFGGDALVIYYDMIYQVCHGSGITLNAMNYPYGDNLIMTDSNAAITYVLMCINNIYPICDLVPGILHCLILYLLPLTSVFLYLLFRKLNVSNLIGIIGSILIAFLSPQMLRILGHFGLAFPFIIPMTIYWFVKKYESERFEGLDIFFGLILLFFFINNPYVGFAATSLLMVGGVLVAWKYRYKGFYIFLCGFVPTILSYIIIQGFDPFSDRIEMQWGFFYFYASIHGMLFPPGGLIYDYINPILDLQAARFEGRSNLGVVTSVVSITAVFFYIKSKITGKLPASLKSPEPIRYLLWASLLIFIYAANYSLYGFAKPFIEEHLGPLLMFKASGRLAWPVYFVVSVYTITVINNTWTDLKRSDKKILATTLLLAAFSLWAFESVRYNKNRFKEIHYGNPFNESTLTSDAVNLGLDTANYQAIYSLPIIQSWNDKFYFPTHFQSQFSTLLLSAKTGLPLINAMLSRAPTASSLSSIQVAGHPLLHKSRLDELPTEKPILLVLGNSHPALTIGEQDLIDHADYIGKYAKSNVYSLNPKHYPKVKFPAIDSSATIIQEHFNDPIADGLVDDKCFKVTAENNVIWSGTIDATFTDSIEVSIWHFLDHTYHYLPKLEIIADGVGKDFYNRASRDIYKGWVRQAVVIPRPSFLEVISSVEKPYLFDELQIRPINNNTQIIINNMRLINNYPIDK